MTLSTTNNADVFKRVLTIGPSLKGKGGMSSVLNSYADHLPYFRHISTNSPRGTFMGLFSVANVLLRLPLERLKGKKILHVHVASGKSFVRKSFIIRLAHLMGYKIIFHSHSGNISDYFTRVGTAKAEKALRCASVVVALSESWKEYFETTFNLDNVVLLHNPVSAAEDAVPQTAPELSIPPLRLLYLGMLTRTKGVFELLEAFIQNRERWHGRVELNIGGVGDAEEEMKELVQATGLTDMVKFHGWVTDADKHRLLNQTNAVILPSYAEGLPVSILEGMVYGKAIIATAVGGIPEVVHSYRNGILIPRQEVEPISNAIDCYLINPDLLKRHGALSQKIVTPYLVDNVVNRLGMLYSYLSSSNGAVDVQSWHFEDEPRQYSAVPPYTFNHVDARSASGERTSH
jgi:glycosyltransferase involved in cell wall biosynthesis